MTQIPASKSVRERLRQAQQAETCALKALATANNAFDRLKARTHEADIAVTRAQADVVAASGLERAAFLLGVEPATLRRRLRSL